MNELNCQAKLNSTKYRTKSNMKMMKKKIKTEKKINVNHIIWMQIEMKRCTIKKDKNKN